MLLSLDLSSLNGTSGFSVAGKAAYDSAGFSVASAGDINGDGFDDVIISAPGADGSAGQSEFDFGAIYVVFGKSDGFGAEFDLSSLNGINGFQIFGESSSDVAGASVASAGDVNGDGVDDLIIGAPGASSTDFLSGSSYVIFGKTTGFSAELSVASLDGANGFQFSGGSFNEQSGGTVASAGDINGDGFDDVIIGAPYADGVDGNSLPESGGSYVVFGNNAGFAANMDLFDLDGSGGFVISGVAAGDRSGSSVASAGDVNGDGIDDLIIGAKGVGSTILDDFGASYIVFGKLTGFAANLDLATLDGTNGFRINGVNAFESSGESVASAGDVNGDGFDDIIIGAGNGAGYVVFGKASGFSGNLNLKTLNGANGFVLTGWTGYGSYRLQVASAGDFNGDGIDDITVGIPGINSSGTYQSGATYLIFGRNGGFGEVVDVAKLGLDDGILISGSAPYGKSGGSVASAGDINGDGFDDLIIGAPNETRNGTQSGAGYIVFGHAKLPNVAPEGADNSIELFGNSTHIFSAADFGFSDQDGNMLYSVIISTLPADGTLTLNDTGLAAGTEIMVDALGGLVWTPAADNGGPGKGSFTFQVVDDGGTADGGHNKDATPNTINFNVIADDYKDNSDTIGIVITDGSPVSGEIEYANDLDLFKIKLQSGKAYLFDLISTSGIDPTLILYDQDVDSIISDDDGGIGANSRIAFFANQGGTYYLGAKGFDENDLGTYEISAKLVTDDFTDEADTTSGVVTVGGAAISGEIQFPHDSDLFKVNLNVGTTYVFDLSGTNGLDTRLELYAPNYYLLEEDDDSGPGNNDRITFTASQSGTYFLRAQTSYSSDTGAYQIEANLYNKPGNHAPALIEQAPVLENGTEDTKYKIDTDDLLAGYVDDDGDYIFVVGLTSDTGIIFEDGPGDLIFKPTKDYHGIVNLSYFVVDGNGGSIQVTSTFTLAGVTDYRNGGRGSDKLFGTNDHDVLKGKAGNDQLTGKAGSDTFIFWKGYDKDVIRDFDAVGDDHDILNLKKLNEIHNFKDLMQHHVSEKNGNVVINGLHGDVVTLKGVDLDDLGKSDFIF